MDLVVRVPRHPRVGETVLGTSFSTYLGGKGFNQALACARLGADVEMIGCVGADDFGTSFVASLEAEGVGHAAVRRDGQGTGVAVPIVDARGQNAIVMVPQSNMRLTVEDVRGAAEAIRSSQVLLLQLEVPLDACLEAAALARSAGATVVWNLAPCEGAPEGALAAADVVVVNESEAAGVLGGAPSASPEEAIECARRLRSLGAGAAVVTLGAGGAAWASAANEGHSPAFPAEPVDTVGAGDAFCGALAVVLAGGGSLAEGVRAGNAAGSLAVAMHGAGPSMPRRDRLMALLQG